MIQDPGPSYSMMWGAGEREQTPHTRPSSLLWQKVWKYLREGGALAARALCLYDSAVGPAQPQRVQLEAKG